MLDPGTGVDAAHWLARQPAVAPVVVHTTNSTEGTRMMDLLLESGWNCNRVVPYGGEDWIGESWLPKVRTLIVTFCPTSNLAATGLHILKSHWGKEDPVHVCILELIRAARCQISGSSAFGAIAIEIIYLDSGHRLAPLIPGDGILGNIGFGVLQDMFDGANFYSSPRSIGDSQLGPDFENELTQQGVRQLQVDVIRVPNSEPMQAFMMTASLCERILLESHRTQSTLAELKSLVEVAIMHEASRSRHADLDLARPKKRRQ